MSAETMKQMREGEVEAVGYAGHLVAAFATGRRASAWLRRVSSDDVTNGPSFCGGVRLLEGAWSNIIVRGGLAAEHIHFEPQQDEEGVIAGVFFADVMSPSVDTSLNDVRDAIAEVDAAVRLVYRNRGFLEWTIETLLRDGEVAAEAAEAFFVASRAPGRQVAQAPGAA
jgi:hypothetical protein